MKRHQDGRPLSPRISVYRWQFPMLASFAHRISGVLLVLLLPGYLYCLNALTGSPDDYSRLQAGMHSVPGRFMLWLAGTALIYHLVNGIRFILLDAGCLESRDSMRLTARLSLAVGALAALALGGYLW
jgi:succinate dehydrogenase cytochrome b subunit